MQQPHPYLRLEPDGQQNGQTPDRLDAGTTVSHAVQFYEDEKALVAVVADHLGDALRSSTPVVLLATPEHTEAILWRLRSRGFDIDALRDAGTIRTADARTLLGQVMRRHLPDPRRFRAAIEPLISQAARRANGAKPRVFGELVDLLMRDGNPRAAVRLEELWGSLLSESPVSLLCAYHLGSFATSAHQAPFEQVCRAHDHVVPTERVPLEQPQKAWREIALLQQRSHALENEVSRRKEIERRLRESSESNRKAAEGEAVAKAEASAASRAKADFLAVVSHELRTPLNAIGGHVQLLELGIHGPLNEAQLASLARVGRSQRHLLSLINDLLNLTRIESGRLEYDMTDLALPNLIREVMATLEPMISAKSLDYGIETVSRGPSARPLTAHADAEKLRQVLVNLLTNAVKFTPAGGRIAVITEASSLPDESMIRVHVRDTGVGIHANQLEHIFEPFVQLGARIIDRAEGLGLGLAISRELARGMGGDLTVSSVVGEGTTFTLSVRRAADAA